MKVRIPITSVLAPHHSLLTADKLIRTGLTGKRQLLGTARYHLLATLGGHSVPAVSFLAQLQFHRGMYV
ncbi:MAG: hypothetical protein NVSMB46_06970 [Candidatus Saccharimonadales bacterium]